MVGSYQPGDGAGPSIAEQLALEPLQMVLQTKALQPLHGGVRALPTAPGVTVCVGSVA